MRNKGKNAILISGSIVLVGSNKRLLKRRLSLLSETPYFITLMLIYVGASFSIINQGKMKKCEGLICMEFALYP